METNGKLKPLGLFGNTALGFQQRKEPRRGTTQQTLVLDVLHGGRLQRRMETQIITERCIVMTAL